MKKENPFSILMDAYESEAEELFRKLTEDLPEFKETDDELEQLKQSLKETAFAELCMQYLHQVCEYPEHQDFPLVCEEMGFDQERDACFYLIGKEGVEWDLYQSTLPGYTPFISMLSDLISEYRYWWVKEVIDRDEFVERIFGEHQPNDRDIWALSERFFDNY